MSSETLTLKSLQTHLYKAFAGAFAISIVAAFSTAYAFYYRTTDSIEMLNVDKEDKKQEISNVKKDIGDIKSTLYSIQTGLSNNGIYTFNNKEQIRSLDDRVNNIEKKQDEMLKLLYEIKSKR
jgi:septal ring factor EnvC (AmiA/AmiB activator)